MDKQWKVVPVEPTREMLEAADRVDFENDDTVGTLHNIWNSMLAAAPSASGRMSRDLRDFIEGMSVSVDVSTGDHDADHRLFGTISEVMDEPGSKHGVILLMHDQEPNFDPPSASDERERFEAAMVDAGYDKPKRGPFADSQYLYQRDQDRFAGWQLARAALAPSPGVDAAEPPKVTDEEIEAMLIGSGARWDGSVWKIEDADLHPIVRSLLYRYTAAPSPAASADEWLAEAVKLVRELEAAVATATCYAAKPYQVARREARAALLAHLKARP